MARLFRFGHIIAMIYGQLVRYSKKPTKVACSNCEAQFMAKALCIQSINNYRRIMNCTNIINAKYRLLSFALWLENEITTAICVF